MNDWDIDPKMYYPVLGWFRKLLGTDTQEEKACCGTECCAQGTP